MKVISDRVVTTRVLNVELTGDELALIKIALGALMAEDARGAPRTLERVRLVDAVGLQGSLPVVDIRDYLDKLRARAEEMRAKHKEAGGEE